MDKKPVLAITMGDGAGIGPEIIVKALTDRTVYETSNPVVIGDAKRLELVKWVVNSDIEVHRINKLDAAKYQVGIIDVLDMDLLPNELPFGQISAEAGDAAFRYLEKAIQLANNNEIEAIVTAPLNKEALHKGGHLYPGHTEILADLTNTSDYAMMLSAPNLNVIHVTTHIGLIDAVKKINAERVYTVIKLADETLKRAGNSKPKIAVCGINPHAGENGLFGYGEEEEKLIPAIEKALAAGIDVYGPIPADTVFFRAIRGDFDIVVAQYHDQGHIPVKVLGFDTGVNITVGLPIIRTSVDHGTAFDIAGKGIADELSLKEAIRLAVKLAPGK